MLDPRAHTSLSHSATASSSASASASSAASSLHAPPNLKIVGILLAIASGILIGSSFVFKKKGLLRAQAGHAAGEGVAYLKSPLWWMGMTMMIMGELCNFAAYAFVEAIVVTPMGALSVVICAILSSLFLNEKLSLFGWLGCALCIVGSVVIALNGPQEQSVGEIREFKKLFLFPVFLVYAGVLITAAVVIVFYFAPRYGKKNMMWYIMVCSMIGGISVSVTTGLGAAIVTTAQGQNQFNYWFTYFLLVFIAVTLLTEVFYLNKALALFNTAMVTPTYYVIFTFFSMVTTIVLFKGLKSSATQILTLVMGFFTICIGITILQMSKVDPTQLKGLDRRSTLLLQAARSHTQDIEDEKLTGVEDPGIDALRGSFGTVGSIMRAKSAKRMSMSSRSSALRPRHGLAQTMTSQHQADDGPYAGMHRHQLYDAPVPPISRNGSSFLVNGADATDNNVDADAELRSMVSSHPSILSTHQQRTPTIKFDAEETVHTYAPGPGRALETATHERRPVPSHGASFVASPPPMDPNGGQGYDGMPRASPESLLESGEMTATAPGVPVVKSKDMFYHPHVRDQFEDPARARTTSAPTPRAVSPFSRMLSPVRDGAKNAIRAARSPSPRRYPKGVEEDDEEESVGLWQSRESFSDDVDEPAPAAGGIRLVGKDNRF